MRCTTVIRKSKSQLNCPNLRLQISHIIFPRFPFNDGKVRVQLTKNLSSKKFMKLKPSYIILLWANFVRGYKRSMDTIHLLIEN